MTQPRRFFSPSGNVREKKKIHRKQRLQLQQMTAVGPQVHNLPLCLLQAACNHSACRSSSSFSCCQREGGEKEGGDSEEAHTPTGGAWLMCDWNKQCAKAGITHVCHEERNLNILWHILENMSHGVIIAGGGGGGEPSSLTLHHFKGIQLCELV